MSLIFSSVALKAGSVTAMFRDRFKNFMKCMMAFNSFFIALGLRFTWKKTNAINIYIVTRYTNIVYVDALSLPDAPKDSRN